jgi:hypothetical protein
MELSKLIRATFGRYVSKPEEPVMFVKLEFRMETEERADAEIKDST